MILLSDAIEGAFDEIRILGDGSGDARLCTTDRALVMITGEVAAGAPGDAAAMVHEALELIDSLGAVNHTWDLDGDGIVTLEDLRILLVEDIHCE